MTERADVSKTTVEVFYERLKIKYKQAESGYHTDRKCIS